MKKLNVPKYDPVMVADLQTYLSTTVVKKPWIDGKKLTKEFKAKVTELMKEEQDSRCAYCQCHLFETNPHRDHIAPLGKYPEWTFWPANLVLACYACNSDRKKEFDTITTKNDDYDICVFNIVHPFLDEPSEHLGFTKDAKGILIKIENRSIKGKNTINLFDLASPERSKQRAADLIVKEGINKLHAPYQLKYVNALAEITTIPLKTKNLYF